MRGGAVIDPEPGEFRRAPAAQPAPRRPIPHRYRSGKFGPWVLMDCRDCRTPWAPDVEIPRDRLCDDCRAARAEQTPTIPGIDTDPETR